MKTRFRNMDEAAHVWAQQVQDVGYSGNINFKGDTIYSYGWWPIARFVTPNVVFFRNWSYSSSTSKHISAAQAAIGEHIIVFYCYNPTYEPVTVMLEYVQTAKRLKERFSRATKNKRYILDELYRLCIEAKKLSNIFNIKNDLSEIEITLNSLTNEMTEYYKLYEQRKALRFEKSEKQNQKAINWINETVFPEITDQILIDQFHSHGKGKSLPELPNFIISYLEHKCKNKYYYTRGKKPSYKDIFKELYNVKGMDISLDLPYVCLRLSKDRTTIETSKQAYVTVKEAKLLWAMIKTGRDIKGYQIGYYTVISLNDQLKIGCHDIPMSEVKYIGEILDNIKN